MGQRNHFQTNYLNKLIQFMCNFTKSTFLNPKNFYGRFK
jgi:hypothetical protein